MIAHGEEHFLSYDIVKDLQKQTFSLFEQIVMQIKKQFQCSTNIILSELT